MALDQIPPELLEYIAYFVATDELLGPPAYLVPLLSTNRKIHDTLSSKTNTHLYAAIFEAKFDVGLARRRLGDAVLTPAVLTTELKRRMQLFQSVQAMTGATDTASGWDLMEGVNIDAVGDDIILTAYLMMLENQGKNEAQLRHHAHLHSWLRCFWFHERGRSGALRQLRHGSWPINGSYNAMAMWLFWLFLKTDEYPIHNDVIESPTNILKVHALGAHKYDLSVVPWDKYEAVPPFRGMREVTWYSQEMQFVPPPLSIPAILSYLVLTNRRRSLPLPPSDPSIPDDRPLDEWSTDWNRAFSLVPSPQTADINKCFIPGSLEGFWEGFFTYTEFTAYAVILRGAPPQVLQNGVVGRHQQTWKIREYYYLGHSDPHKPAACLPPGDPLRSYIPANCRMTEHRDRLVVEEPGLSVPLHYMKSDFVPDDQKGRVRDVLLMGEGHSSWGQFSLIGRVRPFDGFVSFSKNYVDGERGTWLYRGYLVGNCYGSLSGRWRETFTSSALSGYEGCFALSRRR